MSLCTRRKSVSANAIGVELVAYQAGIGSKLINVAGGPRDPAHPVVHLYACLWGLSLDWNFLRPGLHT